MMELEYIDDNRQYENYKKDIVTKIAYLIGVKDSIIKTNRFEQNIISSLEENDNAKIIRALSILRSEFIRNFKEISSRNMNLEPLETLTDLISVDLIKYLRNKGIEIVHVNANLTSHIAYANQIILEKIDLIKDLIPSWIKWEYVTKDIIDRNKIRNEEVFNAVIDLLCSQIGCYVSPNKIANTLVSNGFKTVDNDTVSNYLKYLCDAFLFYKAVRYDLKGKEYLKTLNKYYICDLGLRNQRLGYRQMEMTHIIENIVYLELLRRNYQVDIGKNKESEIDFVVRSHDDLYYIQVSLSIENESTRMREENAFKGLDDGYKKIIITMDNNPLIHLERGYKMLNLFNFLLNENILKSI